jgi:TM2 domain-containing membrane protein YozV
MAQRSTDQAASLPACLLACLIPGLGHLYLRRTTKGLVFLGAIVALYVLGVALDARLSLYVGLGDPLALLRSVAQMAVGLPYFVIRSLGYGLSPEAVTSITHEYGNTFTEVGGLLNILVVLDAYDVAVGRKS